MFMEGVCGLIQNAAEPARRYRVPPSWVLLDNQSTINLFHNKEMLINIKEVKKGMTVHCNAGTTVTNMMGMLPGYGEVWYDPNAIANILSLKRVKEEHRVTYDSVEENAFVVHKEDGANVKFRQSPKGLYYCDMEKEPGVLLVNTVESVSYTHLTLPTIA